MANPAFQRPEDTDDRNSAPRETEMPADGELSVHSTAELIAQRDRLLEECLELEAQDGVDSTEAEPVRIRIDEIHQELALRDLAERVGSTNQPGPVRPMSAAGEASPPGPSPAAQAAQRAFGILDAIETRSRFMDELAQAAREQGRLDQAAAFALNAQKLDMERVEVLRKLSAMGTGKTGTEE